MIIQVVGFWIGFLAGAIVSGLAGLASNMRVGAIGAPLIGGLVGGASTILLQMLGAGAVQFDPVTGTIDWPPVLATLASGAGCGLIASLAIALMRYGGRAESGRARRTVQRHEPVGDRVRDQKPIKARGAANAPQGGDHFAPGSLVGERLARARRGVRAGRKARRPITRS